MLRKALSAFCLAALLAIVPLATASGNQITNGGFETPVLPGGAFLTIAPGSEPAGFAWQVSTGNVDVGHLPVIPFVDYSAYELVQALDLNGTTIGGIQQDFATVPGTAYSLSFAYADNPFEGGISSATVKVIDLTSTLGLLTDSISHSTSTNSPAFADWILYGNTFVATGPLTRLSFVSTSASASPSGGIFLDDVQVNAVPEPGTLTMMSLGGLALGLGIRRRVANSGRAV